ncbi:MAG: hypothetical protein WDA25_06755 [Paracoccaceae bacterium]
MFRKTLVPATIIALALPHIGGAQDLAQISRAGPLEDIYLEVTKNDDDTFSVSQTEFNLSVDGYYRLNFVCPDEDLDDYSGFHFESTPLLSNAHLRVISVGDQEIYMQGLTFRALQCDEEGAIRFSFHPVRTGTYEFLVRDHAEPPNEITGNFIVE